jgi:hypothetical protein
MPNLTIHTKSLTLNEVKELMAELSVMDGIESANYLPDIIGKPQWRTSPMAGIPEFRIVLHRAEGAAFGIGAAATNHLYQKAGEALVDKAVDWFKARLTDASVVEVGATLYGPDDKQIKKISRTR